MNILVIGRGGREHALAWSASNSAKVKQVYIAPGNAGTSAIGINVPIDELDNKGLVAFAKENKIDLTIVGPESALSNGVVDAFVAEGLLIFGPTKAAAMIESSKQFAKDLMKEFDIPTAAYQVFSDYEKAVTYVKKMGVPIVIKYDGLAAGKGVVVATTFEEANDALKSMLLDSKFGNDSVVIEECLEGPEFSLMTFVNGNKVYPMVISQDHKRAYDNDLGPNTGGMGIYSPVPIIPDKEVEYAIKHIMEKTASAMVSLEKPFTGFLYGGLMLTKHGVKVIEFNARFGDPETEVILPRLENDFIDVLLRVLQDQDVDLTWKENAVMGVVMASNGYPNAYEKNHLIEGLDQVDDLVFHMGTKEENGMCYTNGGRVLLVTGSGKTLEEAKTSAYRNVEKIKCDNLFYRSDIGYRALKK